MHVLMHEMKKALQSYTQPPLGRLLSGIGKSLLNTMNLRLCHLDIERNFYALILIEEGKGKIAQQDLADLLETDKVSVVRIIDYLSNKGYVKREKDPSDRRKYGLVLTEKAEKEIPLIKKVLDEVIQNALSGITPEKVDELYDTLNKIKQNIIK